VTTSAASYDPEKVDEVLRLMHHGKTLTAACRSVGLAMSSFLDWKAADVAGLGARYARARDGLLDRWSDEIVDIADDRMPSAVEAQHLQRLSVESRKWLLSKLRPEQYGDSSKQMIDMTLKGEDPATVLAARRKAREGE
jgi:hypothetical protein